MNTDKQKIEQILLKNASFTSDQAKLLLETKDEKGRNLEEVLKKKVTITGALKEVSRRLNISFLPEIPFSEIPIDLIADLPIQYVKSHGLLPYKEKEGTIQVLTSNPLNVTAFNNLKVKFNKRIEPVMSFHYKIQEAINHVYEKKHPRL